VVLSAAEVVVVPFDPFPPLPPLALVLELPCAEVVEFEKRAEVEDAATEATVLSATSGPAETASAALYEVSLMDQRYFEKTYNEEAAIPFAPLFDAAFGVVPLPITVNLVQSSADPR
jgi:hypothetical protein